MIYYERMDREIKEAQHNVKRHRVEKRTGSTDDQFQSLVGAYFLSDTVSAAIYEDTQNLYDDHRLNLIGGKPMERVIRELGYNTF